MVRWVSTFGFEGMEMLEQRLEGFKFQGSRLILNYPKP